MNRTALFSIGVAALFLAACSSSPARFNDAGRSSTPSNLFATGPIYSACQLAGRREASRARCGCVQAVADQSLNANDQRRGSVFFDNPGQAQEVRTSDRDIDERFWLRWKAYSERAARLCT
ncbi:hypothetical protein [uncultured Tateyamaria sp.]|uniref:hypothetical protein n=1 Tax=uncultured Tateyamaria sp. TaxID=455651 RepID=UPI002622F6F2|nr:hypothetical protein [uncultured Tateyamaria sp.]